MVGAKSSEGFLVAKIRRQEITEYRMSLRVHAARGTYCHAEKMFQYRLKSCTKHSYLIIFIPVYVGL